MFPFEDEWEHVAYDEYGASLDYADFDAPEARGGLAYACCVHCVRCVCVAGCCVCLWVVGRWAGLGWRMGGARSGGSAPVPVEAASFLQPFLACSCGAARQSRHE